MSNRNFWAPQNDKSVGRPGRYAACGEPSASASLGQQFMASWDINQIPSGYVKIAIENGHRNSGFSH